MEILVFGCREEQRLDGAAARHLRTPIRRGILGVRSSLRFMQFENIKLFFSLVDRIRKPSNMPTCDYSLFKEEMAPVWETEHNKNGGRLVYQVTNFICNQIAYEHFLTGSKGRSGSFQRALAQSNARHDRRLLWRVYRLNLRRRLFVTSKRLKSEQEKNLHT